MPLTLRPTGLSSPAYRDQLDYIVCEDGKAIGRMYDDRRGREQRSRWLGARRATPDPSPNKFSRLRTEHDETCVYFTAALSIRLRPLGLLLDDT